MIYTEQTRTAMCIAYEAHDGQRDKSGVPYLYHPIHLAEQMTDEATTAAALLHDVVEDTEWTLDALRAAGISEEVLEAVALLTHSPDVPYLDYVRELAKNPISRAVKLADLKHNSDPSRMEKQTESWKRKCRLYAQAIELLEE
jgi:(p)ppGpp synthase/HD superfamily hydrolase